MFQVKAPNFSFIFNVILRPVCHSTMYRIQYASQNIVKTDHQNIVNLTTHSSLKNRKVGSMGEKKQNYTVQMNG